MSDRLGAVPYLNALPLIHFLKDRPRLEVPSRLEQLLLNKELDVVTAPILTYLQNPHLTLIPDIGIGCDGDVLSVKLVFTHPKKNWENIEQITLDPDSRTSIHLLKVLLLFKYGRKLDEIRFTSRSSSSDQSDALLLIGDKALLTHQSLPSADLGREWKEWTGLPFVFAAWISQESTVNTELHETLKTARDRALNQLDALVPRDFPMEPEKIRVYLKTLNYQLGPREREGLLLFHQYLREGKFLT